MSAEASTTALPPVKRRNAEAVLLAVVIFITLFAFAVAGLTRNGAIPPGLFGYGMTFGGLLILAHVAIRFFAPYADPLLLPCAALLNGLGLAMIWRLRQGLEGEDSGVGSQLMFTAIGMAVFAVIIFFLKEPRVLQRYPYLMALGAVILLLLPLIPGLGQTVNGARAWIALGPLSGQPSEFAKIALVIFLSGYLVMKRDVLSLASKRIKVGPVPIIDLPRMRDMGPMAVAWGFCVIVLVLLMNDLGTSLLLFGTFLAMIYAATQRSSWLIIGLVAFLAACLAIYPITFHLQTRVVTWLNTLDPEVYNGPLGANSQQLAEGLFALAEGGILGTGLGAGKPGLVPQVQDDFIFAAFGAQLGLTGIMVMIMTVALLVERGMRVSIASKELFIKMFAAGISFLFAFQTFVVIGGVTRVIPMTGATIPFVSAGGSSLLASWIMLALLTRMSNNARKPAPQAIQDEGATQVISR